MGSSMIEEVASKIGVWLVSFVVVGGNIGALFVKREFVLLIPEASV